MNCSPGAGLLSLIKINHSLNLKVDKASKNAIKLISDKKGKIDYNEKIQSPEKKISKQEKVKKN